MLLPGNELEKYVNGIVHKETQISHKGLDLTVADVSRPTSATNLDFGGGEENIGQANRIDAKKRSKDDDYAWWNLEAGVYIISYNENFEIPEGIGIIVPLSRLSAGGSFHNCLMFTGELEQSPILSVAPPGLNLKENARLSKLLVWR